MRDLHGGAFPAAAIRKVGLGNPQAVRLAMAPDAPAAIQTRILKVAEDIISGRTTVPESYEGPEFATPAA